MSWLSKLKKKVTLKNVVKIGTGVVSVASGGLLGAAAAAVSGIGKTVAGAIATGGTMPLDRATEVARDIATSDPAFNLPESKKGSGDLLLWGGGLLLGVALLRSRGGSR